MVGLASTIFQYDRLRIRLIPGPHVAADEIEIRSKTMLLNSNGLAAKDEELPRSGLGCLASTPVEMRMPLKAIVLFLPR
jgi:hypothetical protein